MGQSIVVLEKPSSNPGVVRFETNRAITGMGHERYVAGTEVWGHRPPDELARRLLARGGVAGVQINGNVFIHGFSSVPNYPASHGCIRMPLTNGNPAKFFYEWVQSGTPVSVTKD